MAKDQNSPQVKAKLGPFKIIAGGRINSGY